MSVNGHGGARTGAGRPRNSELFAKAIASFHDRAAADLPTRYDKLAYLADGGYEEVEIDETWQPAGLVMITNEVITKTGTFSVQQLAFPKLPADQEVCIQRRKKTRIAAPDRLANQYLVDRVAGKPIAAVEISGPAGEKIEVRMVNFIERRSDDDQ